MINHKNWQSILLLFITLWGMPALADNNWETIKLSYDFHFKGTGGIEKLMSPEGENIIHTVQNFISDPTKEKYINSKDGKKLLNTHEKYLNFLRAKKILEKCKNNKNSNNHLEKSILTGILNFESDSSCQRESLQFVQNITDIHRDVSKAMDHELAPIFEDELINKSLLNTLSSYIKMKYRYDKNFLKDEVTEEGRQKIIDKFCGTTCSKKLRKNISNTLTEESKYLRKKDKKVTLSQVTENINSKISNLNNKLEAIDIKRDEGAFSDYINNGVHFVLPFISDTADPDLTNKDTQNKFNSYLKEYMKTTSTSDGLLMHTESIRDEMGGLRTLNTDEHIDEDTTLASSTYQFKKHERVTHADVKGAVKDMYAGIDDQILKLQRRSKVKVLRDSNIKNFQSNEYFKNKQLLEREIKYKQNETKKNIKYLIKTNPKAVSQILATSPEYASLVCKSLIQIDKDDTQDSNSSIFIWGGVILGAAGFLTGGLTWLLGAGLSVGAAATLGTVTTGLIIASTASSVAGGAISFSEAQVLNTEAQSIENGILSGGSYTSSSEKMRDSYLAYKDALYEATTSAALSLTGMGALGALNKFGKNGTKFIKNNKEEKVKITDDVVARLGNTYRFINKNKKVSMLIKKTVNKLGANGQQKLDKFLAQVAYLPQSTRKKLLAGLLKLSPDSSKLANIIRKSQCK